MPSNTPLHPGCTIAVCGGGGFIGGHMVARLRQDGFTRIRSIDLKPLSQWHQSWSDVENITTDLSTNDGCQRALNGIDYVINLAADMGGMGFIAAHQADCMRNVLINSHLLESARAMSVKSYFFASSACVYNRDLHQQTKLREESVWPALPVEGYGLEKLFSEEMCRTYRADYGVPASVARFDNIYGPFDSLGGEREKAPAALCRKIAEAKISGSHEIEVWGDGEQRRSILYVTDVVEGALQFIAHGGFGPVNLGSEESLSINELIDMVENIAGIKCQRIYLKDKPQGVRSRCCDISRMREATGWTPKVSSHQGLENTYRWIYDSLSKRNHIAQVKQLEETR